MSIRQLPPLLVNQIAAGEVIERPASVVKELIENAIDAAATAIEIEIEVGGTELIRITDNGSGIPVDELQLALSPHATSKIAHAFDLDRIATLGFRGEALASICSVSRVSIRSRTAEAATGGIIEAEGDSLSAPRPVGTPPGTVVSVRNLFFNTPARRKFLRTPRTETTRVRDIIETIALAHPAVGFTLTVDGTRRLELSPNATPRERAIDILGGDLSEQLLEVNEDAPERAIALWGMVGLPEIARANANHIRLYLNGRAIRDRSLHHALREAYRGLIEPGRYPTVALFLEMDPGAVDVNVHPAKAEVRFRNGAQVHGLVYRVIKDRLRGADLTPKFDFSRRVAFEDAGRGGQAGTLPPFEPPREFGSGGVDPASSPAGAGTSSDAKPRHDAASFVEYFKRLDPTQKGFIYSEVRDALARESPERIREDDRDEPDGIDHPDHVHVHAPETGNGAHQLPTLAQARDVLQIHSSYIVTQDEHGIVIIDQHALHERVMFEKLRERIGTGSLESQRLLMPETIDLSRGQVDRIIELKPLLSRIGVEAEQIGPTSIAVHAFPSFLFHRNVSIRPFMTELFDRATEGDLDTSGDGEASLHEVLDMMACKAAVKAGDRLSESELRELIACRDTIERSSNCPHGRPTTLRLSIEELNRQFGRS